MGKAAKTSDNIGVVLHIGEVVIDGFLPIGGRSFQQIASKFNNAFLAV